MCWKRNIYDSVYDLSVRDEQARQRSAVQRTGELLVIGHDCSELGQMDVVFESMSTSIVLGLPDLVHLRPRAVKSSALTPRSTFVLAI